MKKGIVYIINLFLVICIFALSSILIFSNTILSKQYVLGVLEKNNYYERTYHDIQDGFKNYIMQSGLDESVLEDLYSQEQVKQDIDMVINGIYENKNIKVDTQLIKKTLDDRISKVLKQNNRVPDREEKEAIQTFENAIVETYANGIAFSQRTVEQIGNVFAKIQNMVSIAKVALMVVIVVLIAIIVLVNRNVKETVTTMGIALLSSGILGVVLKLLLGDRMHNILMLNATFSDTVVYLIKAIINAFFTVGIVMTIIGIVAIIVGSMNKEEKQNRKH